MGQKVDLTQIIFNSLCSELDKWYKYIKENKGDKKNTCQSTLVLAKIFQYLFVHQKENPQKPPTKVKKTKEEMHTTLENKKKATRDSLRSALKKKNKVEDKGSLSLGIQREQDNINVKGTKNDEGQSRTICNANIGMSSANSCTNN